METDDILTLHKTSGDARRTSLLDGGEEGDRVGLPRALWEMGRGRQARNTIFAVAWLAEMHWSPKTACMATGGEKRDGASSGGRSSTSASVIGRTDAGQG